MTMTTTVQIHLYQSSAIPECTFEQEIKRKKPLRFDDFETSYISITDVEKFTTYEEAMMSSSSKSSQRAIISQLKIISEYDIRHVKYFNI